VRGDLLACAKPDNRDRVSAGWVWLARLIAGEAAVLMGTEARGASNAKAKRELGWTPQHHPSWRQGFALVYAKPASATAATPARTGANVSRAPQ
jgi:hypothetical protein